MMNLRLSTKLQRDITFYHVDPLAASGSFSSMEFPSPFFNLASPEESLNKMLNRNDIVIPEKKVIRVMFDYPLDNEQVVEIFSSNPHGGFTRGELAQAVANKYQAIYREDAENGQWGIWGHRLQDLCLATVTYNSKKDIFNLEIDS